jgi:hypothetical protein
LLALLFNACRTRLRHRFSINFAEARVDAEPLNTHDLPVVPDDDGPITTTIDMKSLAMIERSFVF